MLIEASVAIPPRDMPEPDITATSEPDDIGPVPIGLVALVVEGADATLEFDLGRKRSRYADAGILKYWVVDVAGRLVHQMWEPVDDISARERAVPFGEPITAATIPGLTIATDRLG